MTDVDQELTDNDFLSDFARAGEAIWVNSTSLDTLAAHCTDNDSSDLEGA